MKTKNTTIAGFTKSNKKVVFLFSVVLLPVGIIYSQATEKDVILVSEKTQVVYDNFEGVKCLHYTSKTGVLDSLAKNPGKDEVNRSKNCALYVRNEIHKFDNIKMSINGKLTNVTAYATHIGNPPRIKMKVYTSAPAGTLVEILLGSRGRNNEYPAGTNSQYQAYTKISNAWQELEFTFSQVPEGSETSFTEIDQVTLLFNPNTLTSDTYYFDEVTGPFITHSLEFMGSGK